MAAVPPTLKSITSYLKLAKEYDKRDPTVAYFCRMYTVQKGIKLDSKTPACKTFLFGLMDQLEMVKKELLAQGEEAVTNDIVAQAHIESVCVNLFVWADSEDRQGVFNKNVVKGFYSSSLLFDVLTQFGELSDECQVQQKYAKWKATYLHKCMQTGEVPAPGPEGSGFENDLNPPSDAMGRLSLNTQSGYSSVPDQPFSYTQSTPPPPSQTRPIPTPREPSSKPLAVSYVEPGPSQASSNQAVDFSQAGKFCKFAMSALQYEDVETAVDNLKKALDLLQPGSR